MMAIVALALFFLALLYFGFVRMRTLLAYFQQEEYDPARFLIAWRTIRLFDVMASVALIIGFVLVFLNIWPSGAMVLMALVLALIAERERGYTFKKSLTMTPRATRLFRLALGLAGLVSLIVLIWPVTSILVIQALPIELVIANAILKPGEDRRNQAYIDEASEKLAAFKGIRIGVTGSFGKTSVKHILGQLLTLDAPVFYSRGSINTVLGLTRHIRQRLQPAHKYFIAEMGAYQKGSIAKLADFVKPGIGIITAVGEAHLERFGTLADTAMAKAELADYVCAHGRLVVVTEAVAALEPFARLRAAHPDKFVICGAGDSCDVRLVSSELTEAGRKLSIALGDKRIELVSPLLGAYNDLNICLCLAVIDAVAPDILPFVPAAAAELEQVPHRLEKRESVTGPLVLDDAYNANEAGMREALAVARALADQRGGRAVIVTPGIVELGARHAEVHAELGTLAGATSDIVHIVNPDRIRSFVRGAQAAKHARVATHASLVAARKALAEDSLDTKDVILYANDLPDVLEEKRIL